MHERTCSRKVARQKVKRVIGQRTGGRKISSTQPSFREKIGTVGGYVVGGVRESEREREREKESERVRE